MTKKPHFSTIMGFHLTLPLPEFLEMGENLASQITIPTKNLRESQNLEPGQPHLAPKWGASGAFWHTTWCLDSAKNCCLGNYETWPKREIGAKCGGCMTVHLPLFLCLQAPFRPCCTCWKTKTCPTGEAMTALQSGQKSPKKR